MRFQRRQILYGSSALLALGGTGCGYLIHPERHGRTGGAIDVPVLIVDLVWLLPGLIPGVICLAVDFSTGCIYRGGGSRVQSPKSVQTADASAIVTIDNDVVAHTPIYPGREATLNWVRNIDERSLKARGQVVIAHANRAMARASVRELI